MTITGLLTIAFVGLILFAASGQHGATAGPAPNLNPILLPSGQAGNGGSVQSPPLSPSKQLDSSSSNLDDQSKSSLIISHQQQQQQQPSDTQPIKTSTASLATGARKSPNTEKLRRGLTNFMNHLNPAPFFVPPQPVGVGGKKVSGAAAAAGAQAEPATIINDGPTADAVIKGPNRLVQARPLGGPLRWGRR